MSFYTEEQIKKLQLDENTHVVDLNEMNGKEEEEIAIPNIDNLTLQILEILEYMNSNEISKLSPPDTEKAVTTKYPYFAHHYTTLLKLLLNGGDINILFDMLSTLNQVKSNKLDIKQAEHDFGGKLAKIYIPKEVLNNPEFKNKMEELKK